MNPAVDPAVDPASHPTTICALASAPGGGERAVIRISGPRAAELLGATCTRDGEPLVPGERGLAEARFHDGRGEQPALVLWMPGPRSYTREDVAELHLPGSPPLARAALDRLLALGAEAAPPGEFTRRAFLNGRIDLTRAEGVLALVSARSAEERRAASALLSGGLDERLEVLRGAHEDLRALAEASLDFDEAEAGHVPRSELSAGLTRVERLLAEARRWESARVPPAGDPRVVLAGTPNAGKSTLFNRLAEEAGELPALVTPRAGTTRDALHGTLRVGPGIRCLLVDTAGVDSTGPDPGPPSGSARGLSADAQGQERARAERTAADLVLWVVDAAGPVEEQAPPPADPAAPRLVVWNKVDLPGTAPPPPPAAGDGGALAVSALTGFGLDELRERVAHSLGLRLADGGPSGLVRVLSARHRQALEGASAWGERARELLDSRAPLDLFAEALRVAVDELDRIAGRTTPEDVLDRIFARFCVGK